MAQRNRTPTCAQTRSLTSASGLIAPFEASGPRGHGPGWLLGSPASTCSESDSEAPSQAMAQAATGTCHWRRPAGAGGVSPASTGSAGQALGLGGPPAGRVGAHPRSVRGRQASQWQDPRRAGLVVPGWFLRPGSVLFGS